MYVKVITKLNNILLPGPIGRWIDRHYTASILIPVAIIVVSSFLVGQMFTTPIHLSQSSFHQAYSSWFDAGGCR